MKKEFAMSLEPVDYQISLHVYQMQLKWGAKNVKAALDGLHTDNFILRAQAENLAYYFGAKKVLKVYNSMKAAA